MRLPRLKAAGAELAEPAPHATRGSDKPLAGLVSLAVVVSAGAVAIGLDAAEPLIGLAISLVILRVTWQSLVTVRGDHALRSRR